MDEVFRQFFDFSVVFEEGNFGKLIDGFLYTLLLSAVSGLLALIWGLVLALLRQLPGKVFAPVRFLTVAYIDVFRGVPLLLVVLIIFGSFGALAFEGTIPQTIGIPRWFGLPDPFWYGVFAITLTYGAYMAEVFRAGIEAVPRGQMEAARSLGMSHAESMRYVIVPQAVRKVVPPLLNDFIALMKDTSLVSVIGLLDVVQVGRDIQSETFNSSALTFGALLFLLVTIPLARVVDSLITRQQRRTSRGGEGTSPPPVPTGLAGA